MHEYTDGYRRWNEKTSVPSSWLSSASAALCRYDVVNRSQLLRRTSGRRGISGFPATLPRLLRSGRCSPRPLSFYRSTGSRREEQELRCGTACALLAQLHPVLFVFFFYPQLTASSHYSFALSPRGGNGDLGVVRAGHLPLVPFICLSTPRRSLLANTR